MKVKGTFFNFFLCNLMLITSAATLADENAIDDGTQSFYDGDYQQAEAYFRGNLSNAEMRDEALIYLGRIALETGDFGQAVEHIEKVLEGSPRNIEAVILSADIYCEKAQNSSIFNALRIARKCIGQYETAIDMDNKNIEALVSATRFHLHAPSVAGGSTRKGREFLEELTTASPEHAATVTIGWHEEDGERDAAMEIADQLVDKGFQFPKNQYEVARYYKDVNAYDKARPLFEDLSNREKTRDTQWIVNDSLLQLGEIHIAEDGDMMKAIELIEAYKRVNSNPHDAHYFWSTWRLAQAYKAIGQKEKYQALVDNIQSQEYSRDKSFAKAFESDLKKN